VPGAYGVDYSAKIFVRFIGAKVNGIEITGKSFNTNLSGELHTVCPLCGGQELKIKYEVKGYTLTECLSCSAVFVRNILTHKYLEEFYQNQEGNCSYCDDDNSDCINYYNLKLKSEIEKLRPGKGSILDVGCCSGLFLDQVPGWERHGVEVSEKYGEKAKDRIGENIFIGSFEEYPVREEYFDVITLQDVFDHFIDPINNLKKCKVMLKPGGLLVIKVHDISCLFARICGSEYYAIAPPVHLFYFREGSLRFILEQTGFQFHKKRFIGHLIKIKAVFLGLSRTDQRALAYKVYKFLDKSMIGNIKIYKNLHDIITVFAVKTASYKKECLS